MRTLKHKHTHRWLTRKSLWPLFTNVFWNQWNEVYSFHSATDNRWSVHTFLSSNAQSYLTVSYVQTLKFCTFAPREGRFLSLSLTIWLVKWISVPKVKAAMVYHDLVNITTALICNGRHFEADREVGGHEKGVCTCLSSYGIAVTVLKCVICEDRRLHCALEILSGHECFCQVCTGPSVWMKAEVSVSQALGTITSRVLDTLTKLTQCMQEKQSL